MALTISNNSVTSICGLLVAKGLLNQESLDQAKSSSSNSGKNIINILIEISSQLDVCREYKMYPLFLK